MVTLVYQVAHLCTSIYISTSAKDSSCPEKLQYPCSFLFVLTITSSTLILHALNVNTMKAPYDEEAAQPMPVSSRGQALLTGAICWPVRLLKGSKVKEAIRGPDITKSITRSCEFAGIARPRRFTEH